jgi:hypothetical protein
MSNRNNRGFNPRKRESTGRPARRISASNAVVGAVMQAAAIHRVPAYRQQSRCFTVTGAGGEQRPMYMGQWDDMLGEHHFGGMCDVLLTPCITRAHGMTFGRFQVALWIECKSGEGRLSKEQVAFRDHVLQTGGYWLECRDSAEALLAWFREFGVYGVC